MALPEIRVRPSGMSSTRMPRPTTLPWASTSRSFGDAATRPSLMRPHRTLPPQSIEEITAAALPSAPPQEALQADAGRLQFFRQVDQMTATEYEAGRFLWPSQALSLVMVAEGFYLAPLDSTLDLPASVPPPPPAIEENLVDF